MAKFKPIKAKYHPYSGGNKTAKKKVGFFDKLPAEHVLEAALKYDKWNKKILNKAKNAVTGKKKSRSVQPKTNRFAR